MDAATLYRKEALLPDEAKGGEEDFAVSAGIVDEEQEDELTHAGEDLFFDQVKSVISVTRSFFFKLPTRGVKIAKKSPTFSENYFKSPEFGASRQNRHQNPVFFRVLLHLFSNY